MLKLAHEAEDELSEIFLGRLSIGLFPLDHVLLDSILQLLDGDDWEVWSEKLQRDLFEYLKEYLILELRISCIVLLQYVHLFFLASVGVAERLLLLLHTVDVLLGLSVAAEFVD